MGSSKRQRPNSATTNGPIVVGYDGSACSVEAARWAAEEAVLRDVPMRMLTCCIPPFVGDWTYAAAGAVTSAIEAKRATAAANATHIIDRLRARDPRLAADATVVLGSPSEFLNDASSSAALIVLGKSGDRAIRHLLVGSVTSSVIRHSLCAVALVPAGSAAQATLGRIVVGVDGSATAMAALEWAVDEAIRRDAELLVVHAWSSVGHGSGPRRDESNQRASADARVLLNRMVTGARGRGCRTVRGQLVEGEATGELLAQAAEADLIVVGRRGRGRLRSMLFGSVVDAVLEGAAAPVVLIRQPPAGAPLWPAGANPDLRHGSGRGS